VRLPDPAEACSSRLRLSAYPAVVRIASQVVNTGTAQRLVGYCASISAVAARRANGRAAAGVNYHKTRSTRFAREIESMPVLCGEDSLGRVENNRPLSSSCVPPLELRRCRTPAQTLRGTIDFHPSGGFRQRCTIVQTRRTSDAHAPPPNPPCTAVQKHSRRRQIILKTGSWETSNTRRARDSSFLPLH
jgi:hypothetical protein